MRIPGYIQAWRLLRRVRQRLMPRGLILMYHRVGERGADPWNLCVTPQHFAEQMDVLRVHRPILPLVQFVAAQQRGRLPKGAVAITFDDGYVDNLLNARPVLERSALPATVFVTSGQIGGQREFWWDELEQLVLAPAQLPAQLRLTIAGRDHEWPLGPAASYSAEERRRDMGLLPWDGEPGSRLAFYYALWSQLRPLPQDQQLHALNALRAWTGAESTTRPSHRTMANAEIVSLARGGLVAIGAHTVTHPTLPAHSAACQRDELRRSKEWLEALLGHAVTTFSYPFGDYTAETAAIARDIGFACACSTNQSAVWSGQNVYELPRVEVRDWDGVEFERRLTSWLRP